MSDLFEIDFLDVESSKSGDAIAIRYQLNGGVYIHVVDGGYQDTGDSLVEHIKKYYNNPSYIDHVIVTHPDGDHAGGLQKVLTEFDIGNLWMLRPWLYANELLPRFSRFRNVQNLIQRLREIYPYIADLEEIAADNGIPIQAPFQGSTIGAFTVMAPTKTRYLDLIVESDKTPESEKGRSISLALAYGMLETAVAKVINFVRSIWGAETFSSEETSAENEMSIIQYANLCNKRILLTGDAGRQGLREAANYAPFIGLALPGIDRFQVPHHGSRRNVSTELLNWWLGPILPQKPKEGEELFTTIISAAKKDEDHPRKAVVRAMIHRGGKVTTTEKSTIRTSYNAPDREGWVAAPVEPYPEEQEE